MNAERYALGMALVYNKAENGDPRVRRTRQMLHEALGRLLAEKDFDKISIGDITDTATLNRATFYAHFPDKFALLASVVSTRFHELMVKRGVRFDGCEGALKAMALGVCDYLAEMGDTLSGSDQLAQRHIEAAIIAVVRAMVLEGLHRHPANTAFPPGLIASTVAWGIYGAAQEWVRTAEKCPAEQMADVINALVSPIFQAVKPTGSVTIKPPLPKTETGRNKTIQFS